MTNSTPTDRHVCKCVYGEKCPATEPLPLNKSLESELRRKVEVILGVSHVDEPPTEEVAGLVSLIQSELKKQREDIRSKLAKKVRLTSKANYDNQMLFQIQGYNQALQDITKILEES